MSTRPHTKAIHKNPYFANTGRVYANSDVKPQAIIVTPEEFAEIHELIELDRIEQGIDHDKNRFLSTIINRASYDWCEIIFDGTDSINSSVRVRVNPDLEDETNLKEVEITIEKVRDACILFLRKNASENLNLYKGLVNTIRCAWLDQNSESLDGDECDYVVQIAVFGKIIFG